ncbi:MAG: Eco57I restriction-modification methylase domain-containing protein [Proteobacteria bacterium]|nr:Eco57I restriction-modification methylase domain-containing protein [Pseudomonadota bacterium]
MDAARSLLDLDQRRREISSQLDPAQRSALGQFLTPTATARFMAGLLHFSGNASAQLLDPGAGIGALSAAATARWELGDRAAPLSITCYEIERTFRLPLQATLAGLGAPYQVVHDDFIEAAVLASLRGERPFTHVILNPPYKKIATGGRHRALLRKLGLETSNLYAGFLASAVALSASHAQIVAIIPRSWMNGLYFKPFRYWLLHRVAITHIHIFDRRDRAFADDRVLQENVILKLSVGADQGEVEISASSDDSFHDLRRRTVPFNEVVTPGDEELFVHIPTTDAESIPSLPGNSLRELGLDVCTGPVVDFRLRVHLHMQPDSGDAPLLYSTHFSNGHLEWPKAGSKPNAIAINENTRRWLMPAGTYVLTRRFTSKEEKRRVVAYLLPEDALADKKLIGFENHLNVFHALKHGLDNHIARGLCAYLNSQAVDDYFRTFSGHTQVNATDLRRLRYPSLDQLKQMGKVHAEEDTGSVADTRRYRNAKTTTK